MISIQFLLFRKLFMRAFKNNTKKKKMKQSIIQIYCIKSYVKSLTKIELRNGSILHLLLPFLLSGDDVMQDNIAYNKSNSHKYNHINL